MRAMGVGYEFHRLSASARGMRLSLVLIAFVGLCAEAQEAASTASPAAPVAVPAAAPIERVEVTGSRIKRISVEGPSPVTIMDKEAIKKSGHNSVSDLLRDTTASAFGVGRETSGSTAAGVATIGLRGLGSDRTLVLLNGRRLPKDPAAEAVDLNMIPMAAVERIEILKDGASALYGSDALGGVVNIITKKNYNGSEFAIKHVRPEEVRGEQYELSLTSGSSSEKSSLMTVLNYRNNSILFGRDREWSRKGVSLVGNPGSYRDRAGSNVWTVDPSCPPERRVTINGGEVCSYNYQEQASTLPGLEQLTLFTDFKYKLGPKLTFYNVNIASRRQVKWTFAPSPGQFTVAGGTASVPTAGDLNIRYRFSEAGNRETEVEENSFSNTFGLKGFLTDTWEWDFSLGYSRFNRVDRGVSGYLEEDRVAELIKNGTFDPFAAPGSRGSLAAAQVQPVQNGLSRLFTADLLLSGEVFDLDSGAVSAAVGATVFHENLEETADPKTAAGLIIGNAGSSNSGGREVHSAFSEFSIPVTQTVEMQVAGRFDNYSDFGNTVNPKLAVRWQPAPSFLARSSVGTGFLAPSLKSLYGARSEGYPTFIDRKACEEQGGSACLPQQYLTISGGNPDLKEEKALTANLGAVFQPSSDFNISVDGWFTKIDNVVGVDLEKATLAELKGVNVADYGVQITRDPTTGEITQVVAPNQNLSKVEVSGLDVSTEYVLPTSVTGFRPGLRDEFSLIFSYKSEGFPGTGFEEQVDQFGNPKWRNNATLFLRSESSEIFLTGKTIPGQMAVNKDSGKRISDYTEFDLGVSHKFRWEGTVTAGITNLLGTEPPSDPEGGAGGANEFNTALYNPIGRSVYLTYRQGF